MRPPQFWSHTSWISRVLSPLAKLYAAQTAKRVAQTGYKASIPVICVGNLNIGGTGKTPTVIALLSHLSAQNISAHVVSRGYGGSEIGPLRVDETQHTADQVGDEPLLLSAFAPVWVAKARDEGVKAAEGAGAQIVILDDGFQNPSVQKDLSLIVVDAARGFGNGCVIPAGPLREPIDVGLKRADFLLSIGDQAAQDKFASTFKAAVPHLPVPHLKGTLEPLQMGMDWEGQKVLAFAGIGHPEKFFQTVRNLGAELVHGEALSDHQPLTPRLMTRMLAEADLRRAQLVTTEKDAVRLPRAFKSQVLTVPVRLSVEDFSPLETRIKSLLS